MVSWLAPVVGVVVIGVVIELLTRDSRMGQLIRAIYGFFVLFALVTPLPQLLQNWHWPRAQVNWVDQAVVNSLPPEINQTQIQQTLQAMGYPDAVVSVQKETVYISLGQTVTAAEIANIKQQIGAAEVIII